MGRLDLAKKLPASAEVTEEALESEAERFAWLRSTKELKEKRSARDCSGSMELRQRSWTEALLGLPSSRAQVTSNFRTGIVTIPNQGSRALIREQTCRGSFSALSKPFFSLKCLIFRFFRSAVFAHFCTAPISKFADCCCI